MFSLAQKLVVLTYTTNATHSEKLRELLLEEIGETNYLLFASLPLFDGPFRVPSVLMDILAWPYKRAGRPDFFLNNFA